MKATATATVTVPTVTVVPQQLVRAFASSSSFLPLWAGANVTLVEGRLAAAAQALIASPLWLAGGVVSTMASGTGACGRVCVRAGVRACTRACTPA